MTIIRKNYSPLKLETSSDTSKSPRDRKSSLGGLGPITPFDQAAGKMFGLANAKEKSKDDKYAKAKKGKQNKTYLYTIGLLLVIGFCYVAFKKFRVSSVVKIQTAATSGTPVAEAVTNVPNNLQNEKTSVPQAAPQVAQKTDKPKVETSTSSYQFKKKKIPLSNRPTELNAHGLKEGGDMVCNDKECYPRTFVGDAKEWTEIRKGQVIPETVEVRMNIITGKHEGKIRQVQIVKAQEGENKDEKKNEEISGIPQDIYPSVAAALRDRIILDRDNIGYSNLNFDSYLGELLNPHAADSSIMNALGVLEKNNFNFYGGVLDGEGIEILLLLIQKQGDPMIRQKAATILGYVLDSSHEAQMEATKHRVFNVLIRSLQWDKTGTNQVSIMKALLSSIKYNQIGLKIFMLSNGFHHLINSYNSANNETKSIKTSVVEFAAELFHFERSMMEEAIPVIVQDRGINHDQWCDLLQQHVVNYPEDTVISLEALEGLISTSVYNHGPSAICKFKDNFKKRFEDFNADGNHPYALALKLELLKFVNQDEANRK